MTWEEICRRAGGRRHYSAVRKFRAEYRRAHLIFTTADELGLSIFRHGTAAAVARKLGLHRSTVSRDLQRMIREASAQQACRVFGSAESP